MKRQKQEIDNDVLLERINNLISTNKEAHDAILLQTTKTNGRVTNLEIWQNRIIGGLILFDFVIIPLAFIFITKLI